MLTIMTQEEADAAVARGVEFLDSYDPEWVDKIDLPSLQLSNCYRCVLGQLIGNYFHAVEWDDSLLPGANENERIASAYRLGFNVPVPDVLAYADETIPLYEPLQQAWTRAIAARREGRGA